MAYTTRLGCDEVFCDEFITNADVGMDFTAVCLSVCLFVCFPHDISKINAARITELYM